MTLLEALEYKKALECSLKEIVDTLGEALLDNMALSKALKDIDVYVEKISFYEMNINKLYNTTLVSSTESISDVISYIDSLSKKIEILKTLMLLINKSDILYGLKSDINQSTIISTVSEYEDIKNALVKKVRTVCGETSFINQG